MRTLLAILSFLAAAFFLFLGFGIQHACTTERPHVNVTAAPAQFQDVVTAANNSASAPCDHFPSFTLFLASCAGIFGLIFLALPKNPESVF